ncbi:response regulator [Lentisalinibacter salinarum]|uniref:response regulator n=1 Tax=Lentisalinibacter salinarum TaxID=2992239 RepID=UPI00386741B6
MVDDHAIMRDGLTAMLGNEEGLEVVATAADGKAAIQVVDRHEPDLVLIDLSMPRTDGARAISVIKRRHPEVHVVVLTFHKEDVHIHAALQAGADGYVLKDDGRAELLTAVKHVAAGRSYLSPAICDRVMSGYVRAGEQPERTSRTRSWEILTEREREVLKLVAEGYTTRQIAGYLSLSAKTVEKHRANMMRKLGLKNVSAVTTYALENGLLSQ